MSESTIEWLEDVIDNYKLIQSANYDLCILASSDKGFGYKNEILVWIKKDDFENAKLGCRIGNVLGHAQLIDSETVRC